MLSWWQTELEGGAWNSLLQKNTQAPDEEGDICFRPYETITYAIIVEGLYMGIMCEEKSRQFHLYSNKISYIMTYLLNGQMGQLYYGKRIRHRENFDHLLEFAHRDMTPCTYEGGTASSLEYIEQEYPGLGTRDMWYPACGIRGENGSRISSSTYKSYTIQRRKPELPGLPVAYMEQGEEAQTLKLYLEDLVAGMELVLFYTIYERMPVLTRSARFVCHGPELIYLERTIGLSLGLSDPCYQMVDLTGAWCREQYMGCHGLHQGAQSIHSTRGHSNHQFNPFVCPRWFDAGEDNGEVIGISLVYSGNFLTQAEMDTMETVRVTMGIRPEGFDWPLCLGEELQTPEAVTVYSGDGLNDMGQVFHQLYRTRLVRGYWRDRERPILIDSWETTFMDFDEDKILFIADKVRELGIGLFVLDNRQFGKWDNGAISLEDWYPDLHKLPDGAIGLAGEIRDMGMKFDLWFGPEMVSRNNRLYRVHPDWMLGNTGRPTYTGRYQYALDFSKDQVVKYIRNRMEEMLGDGDVSYVRWDTNRGISDPSPAGRDAQYQGAVCHRRILGVHKLYDRLTGSFPHVLFEPCASGGARFDPDILYYTPQDWVSDDTDGVERVKIQYGTSLVYPLSSMGGHMSTMLNHQTQRNVPLAAKAAVVCFGTLGYELDLNLLAEEEQYQVEEQIRFMKEYRKLIQQGRFYRLISPFEGNEVTWIMVSEDADRAIAAYFRFLQPVNTSFERLVLKGLNPGITYRVSGVDYTVCGDELVSAGLTLSDGASGVRTSPVPQGDYLSGLFLVKAQP